MFLVVLCLAILSPFTLTASAMDDLLNFEEIPGYPTQTPLLTSNNASLPTSDGVNNDNFNVSLGNQVYLLPQLRAEQEDMLICPAAQENQDLSGLFHVPRGVWPVDAKAEAPQVCFEEKSFQSEMPSTGRKPGRKKKQWTSEELGIKRKKRLERNRISAQRSRERRNQKVADLEVQVVKLRKEKAEREQTALGLWQENQELKLRLRLSS